MDIDFPDIEQRLVERANRELSQELFVYRQAVASKTAYMLNVHPNQLEDAVQESFVFVYDKLKKGRIQQGVFFQYWVITARNRYLKDLKRQQRYSPLPANLDQQRYVTSDEVASDQELQKRQKIVEEAVNNLEGRYKEMGMYLLENPNVSAAELSVVFGITELNARVRKYRTLTKLKQQIKPLIMEEQIKLPIMENPKKSLTLREKADRILQQFDQVKADYANGKITATQLNRRMDKLNQQFIDLQK